MTSVTSWCDAVKRSRDIQRRVGCAIGQARQVVVWSMSECYGRRGAVYLRQICRADSMRSHMSKRSHKYGVESRVTGVISAVPRYTGSQLFGLLGDGTELAETYRHDQQVL